MQPGGLALSIRETDACPHFNAFAIFTCDSPSAIRNSLNGVATFNFPAAFVDAIAAPSLGIQKIHTVNSWHFPPAIVASRN